MPCLASDTVYGFRQCRTVFGFRPCRHGFWVPSLPSIVIEHREGLVSRSLIWGVGLVSPQTCLHSLRGSSIRVYMFGACDSTKMWQCPLCSLVDWQPFLSLRLCSDVALSSLQSCRLATILEHSFGACDSAEMWHCPLCSLVDWRPLPRIRGVGLVSPRC